MKCTLYIASCGTVALKEKNTVKRYGSAATFITLV